MPPTNRNGNNKAFPTNLNTRPNTPKIILNTRENIKAPRAKVKIVVNIYFSFPKYLKIIFQYPNNIIPYF